MTLPRRIQLVKLLRQTGLRDVERMRQDELKDALTRLRVTFPESTAQAPSSGAFIGGAESSRGADPPPFVDDGSDDPYSLPRFREPRVFIPEGVRTFLRAIAVKPRLVFLTWDLDEHTRASLHGELELHLFWHDFLGDPPSADDIFRQEPALRVSVDLSSTGWYVGIPGERVAVVGALVHAGQRVATSNVTLAPPARPAPPGPLWMATLHPSVDRRGLDSRKLMTGETGELRRIGETDARGLDFIDEPIEASSQTLIRLPSLQSPSSSSSGGRR